MTMGASEGLGALEMGKDRHNFKSPTVLFKVVFLKQ